DQGKTRPARLPDAGRAHESSGLGASADKSHAAPEGGTQVRAEYGSSQGDEPQSRDFAARPRPHPNDRGEGQRVTPLGRENHHDGEDGQRGRSPRRGRLCRRPRSDRAPLYEADAANQRASRRLHSRAENRTAPRRRRGHGPDRARRSMNVKLIVEYEGTRYHGWQAQASAPTIESALRAAITELTGETPTLTAAGRTDAGVHALGQVVNFKLEKPFAIDQLPGALNARL